MYHFLGSFRSFFCYICLHFKTKNRPKIAKSKFSSKGIQTRPIFLAPFFFSVMDLDQLCPEGMMLRPLSLKDPLKLMMKIGGVCLIFPFQLHDFHFAKKTLGFVQVISDCMMNSKSEVNKPTVYSFFF